MVASLDEIRRRLQEQADKKANSGGGYSKDNSLFQFWNIPENSTAVVRFLPDGNETNDFFWVERQVVKMPFNGVKGTDNKGKVVVEVPSMHMWGESCPIAEEIKPWWKDDELIESARVYHKKRSYVYQAFIVNSPMEEENLPENPIRRLVFNKELHEIIKASLMDPDLDVLPTDYSDGLDFRIVRTKKGEYSNYSTSSWSRKSRALSDAEVEAIEKHGLFTLSDFLPKKPTEKDLEIIMQMFEASVAGEPYDPDRWANYYKPFGLNLNKDSDKVSDSDDKPTVKTNKAVSALKSAKKENVEEDEEISTVTPKVSAVKATVEKSEAPTKTKSASDLLAELKRKQAAKQAQQ